jgi:hypothetical protein
MREYLYVIVRNDGTILQLDDRHKGKNLVDLLQEGWLPLRECGLGGELGSALVLLARGGTFD